MRNRELKNQEPMIQEPTNQATLSQEMLSQVTQFSQRPAVFEKGTGNIWTEPYLAQQMLKAHLDLTSDGASRKFEEIEKTIAWFNHVIKNESTILDLGCGPGLYAEKLCASGHQVTGIDFSKNSIRYARNSAQKQGLDIEYVCDDIFNMDYIEQYDVVMQNYGELNTFSDEELNRIFSLAKKALKPEGMFIFDVTTPMLRRKHGLNKNWYCSKCGFWRANRHLVLEEGFEYENDIWLDQYIVIDEEEVTVYRNWYHDYTAETIQKIVLETGFKKVKMIENLLGKEECEEVEWITVIAYR